MKYIINISLLLLAVMNIYAGDSTSSEMSFKITSKAFVDYGFIPVIYTCSGKNISPPLAWSNIPEKTKSLAIVCDDPDAPSGVWVHWVVFNIPATVKSLMEEQSLQKEFPNGMKQGSNDSKKIGYSGPCPPSGVHRYFFKIYALDQKLKLEAGATKAQLLKAMEKHIIAEAQLIGKFKK